ncbi:MULTISPECIES: hypothetical protein [unclassified Mesorhizobium]|uniref:hypothetical protein n=1 Tax=unclassified Mesorhizobium TaxID=325217 RepID=UPI00112DD5EA|nr:MULTISPECIES: hypothetical protein [unclassified Mesorhizobium]TPK42630.1 hypothetical protein FJ550_29690 [Mesorhizobium sp. B2-5-2]TPL26750.1 hypothetical protein FJ946_13010 [Mesorhizobium sp. B2-4-7]TPL40528.1 hypothetical protein FJ961_17310 [Mesorhizobium sp. B2-4-5]TPM76802.1 hypothetical protein FJ968_03540 [Mesorhizobium sp. B2-1-6]TPN72465.1 hypothetical protein FJ985_29195 [Mesorhizobium sp. B1-1-2]
MNANISLDDRIAAAFTGSPTSADVATLLQAVGAADKRAKADHAVAKERALDPATPAADVAKARKAMEDAAFASERMSAAATRLNDLLATTQKSEAEALRQTEMKAALVERDALAADLAREWPELERKMLDLLARLSANSDRLTRAAAGAVVVTAEQIARKAPDNFAVNHSLSMPRLLTNLRLPAFVGCSGGYVWPRLRP